MSVRKMKFVSIVGMLDRFDEFVSDYIIDSGLHLENAMGVITLVRGLTPFANEESRADRLIKSCQSLMEFAGIDFDSARLEALEARPFVPIDNIERELSSANKLLRETREDIEQARERLKECELMRSSLETIDRIDVNVEQFFDLEFVKFRFGKMPRNAFSHLETWSKDHDMVLLEVHRDDTHSWLIYFTAAANSEKVDGLVSSLQFERTRLSSELSGTPQDALGIIKGTIDRLNARIGKLQKQFDEQKGGLADKLLHMYYSLARINRNHVVRRHAMHTERSFYICGWIPEDDLPALSASIGKTASEMVVEDDAALVSAKPPTELRNPVPFRHFEPIVRMYGLPSYGEIDPTTFVALTFFLMFGVMFGDVGQGFLIFMLGIVMNRKRMELGGVFACVGASSMLFGAVYGSVFGNEELLPGLLKPMEDKYTLLIAGVVIGLLFMAAATIMNIANGLREKNLARVLFDRNGVAGMVFYWTLLSAGGIFALTGKMYVPLAVVAAVLAVSFVAVYFKESFERLAEKKSFVPKEGRAVFFVQGIFEMLDMLLSMASNTLSFIRIGAFALSHVGLFMAFHSLSELAGGAGSIVVTIFANVLIIALEGLGVGIQCLRLEYYELFSRFFRGEGKVYRPLSKSML